MIGHQYKCPKKQFLAHFKRFEKFVIYNVSNFVQLHFTIIDVAKQHFSVLGYNRDEIMSVLGVIPTPQTVGRDSIFVFEFVWHIVVMFVCRDARPCVSTAVRLYVRAFLQKKPRNHINYAVFYYYWIVLPILFISPLHSPHR